MYLYSLILVFVARKSDEPDWFSSRDFDRLNHCLMVTTQRMFHFYKLPNDEIQVYLKYHLNCIHFKAMKDDTGMVPPLTNPDFEKFPLFSGFLRTYVNHAIARSRHGDGPSMSFIYSLSKGSPKYWPKLGPEKEAANIKKHANFFSTDHGKVTHKLLRANIMIVSEQFMSKIHRTDYLAFSPSGGACLQNRLIDNGCLGLLRTPDHLELDTSTQKIGLLPSLDLTVLKYRHSNWYIALRHTTNRKAGRSCADDTVMESYLNDINSTADYNHHLLQCEMCLSIQGNVYRDPDNKIWGQNDLRYTSIFEPAKIRGITLQDGFKNIAVDPLKGALLQQWKNSPYSTMLHSDLTEKVQKMVDVTLVKPHLFEKFSFNLYCSGDYAGATDTIKMDATLLAISSLKDNPWREYAEAMFAPGKIHYPKVVRKSIDSEGKVKQELIQKSFSVPFIDGQPMGNPLSFPLLCFINTAIYITCLDVWVNLDPDDTDRLELSRLLRENAIVNGDDIAFICNTELYKIFCDISAEAGFKVSIGKQFLSPHFLQINSQMFRIKNSKVTRCHYLNLNLLTGNNIKGSRDFDMSTPIGISHDLNEMMNNIPWSASCLPLAFQRFRKDFMKTRFQPNWAIPHHLGGYGIDPKFVNSSTPTREQRIVAARILHDPSLTLYKKKTNFYKKLKNQNSINSDSLDRLKKIESLAEKKVLIPFGEYTNPLPQEISVLQEESPISSRIQIYKRFLFPNPVSEDDAPRPNLSILKTNQRNAWIKPLSDEGFFRYNKVLSLYSYKGTVRPLNNFQPEQVASAFNSEPGFFRIPNESWLITDD